MLELAKKDYYGVLKLPAGASEPVIRQRFKRLAKRLHPDVNPSPNAASQFREIREAYDVLTDPARRAVVDSWYAPHAKPAWRTPSRVSAGNSPSTPAQAGGVDAPFTPSQKRPISSVWTAGSDRVWNFCCFAPLGFIAAFISVLPVTSELSTAVRAGVAVALIAGIIAAIGGEKVREWLLWVLSRAWWW
ncbi:MAG: DnaJ domain-containing protein [Thermoanaerobaculia bacterium]|nr:DnaJ domain-containing protein [Thermoanaerobaculia bacterium]